nr:unnamed protein product [Callosobruchus chinensis]
MLGVLITIAVIVGCEGQSYMNRCRCDASVDPNEICFCVRPYQCLNGQVITDGGGIINIRADTTTARKCESPTDEELICCRTNGTQSRSPDFEDPLTTSQPPSTIKPSKKPIKCGVQKTQIQARVFTDEITPIDGEFPWIAAIFRRNDEYDHFKYKCAGSLLHPRVILTVSHYFRRNIQEIVHHPKYYSGGLYYDAALLILDKPYILAGSVNKICLPPKHENLENRTCSLAGWGRGSEMDECQARLKESTYLSKEFVLDESQICAGGEQGRDACDGDGGAPLVCYVPYEDRYFQVGIVSFGAKCGETGVPGVYTDVTALRPWIEEELKKRDLDEL